jgi:hypothetical protein
MQRRWVLTIAGLVAVTGVAAVRYAGAKAPEHSRAAVVLGAVPEATLSQAAYRYRTAGPAHWRDCMLKR